MTTAAKEAIEIVFQGLGGTDALQAWAKSDPDNLKAFYVQIWPKILPLQVNANVTAQIGMPEINLTVQPE